MHGFKSFATKTEIEFEDAMNIIVGPNGSGKSNITDALCFALGRRSIKSIRAAKAANLLFSGTKTKKPAQEAVVELVFDNQDKGFTANTEEVTIKRIVKRSGLSTYKINNETKTRQEMLELLAQAGIDPHGFNIVLQGEIASFVKMSSEERRKVLEEVAGISIYETRKIKSLRELEKTDERLKEVATVLKERNIYLRNLEKEKQEAESFQKLETTIKRCKATILHKNITQKEKQENQVNNQIKEQQSHIEKLKKQIQEQNSEIEKISQKIANINKTIDSSTSGEQETLHKELSDLRANQAGLHVKKENLETHLENQNQKVRNLKNKLEELEEEITRHKSSSPKIKKHQQELQEYQKDFDILEKNRRKFYQIKSEISTLENQKQDRQETQTEIKKELELIQKNISEIAEQIKHEKSKERAQELKQKTSEELIQINNKLISLEKQNLEIEKQGAVSEKEISANEKLKQDIVKMTTCPLCKNKITQTHIKEVIENANQKIISWQEKQRQDQTKARKIREQIINLKNEQEKLKIKTSEIDNDIIILNSAEDKKHQIKKLAIEQEQTSEELKNINQKLTIFKEQFEKLKNIEEQYDDARMKLQELSFADIDVDTEIQIKSREIERIRIELKANTRDTEESTQEFKKIIKQLDNTEENLKTREQQERELYEKFQQFYHQRTNLQDQQKAVETSIIGFQHTIRNHEDKTNTFKIDIARINAEKEALETEFKEFESFETYNNPIEQVREKLQKCQLRISNIGTVNLRALEIYEKVKDQCQLIEEKVETINKEKETVMKIITQIDRSKKKTFMKTLIEVNELFTRNFSQLSKKGQAFLDLENKKEPFEAGLNIIIKVGKGKYFDTTSLSGGEKTLVALALIFAIQEYKPYAFYIFDEIDAALDKHNSELLAALIKKHMQSGQYIIITHNDTLISEATTLYGISMQENISKVISLKI